MSDEAGSEWSTMAVSEAVDLNPRRVLPKTGEVPFLDMASLPLNGAPVVVSQRRPVSSGGARFRAGDTLFARITPSAENGKLGFVERIDNGTVAQGSTEFIVMAARDGLTTPEYVRCLAEWDHVRNHVIGLMEGTSGRQRVPVWAFDFVDVSLPPLDEQRRIAEVLQSVDEAISANQQQLNQSQSVRTALLQEHFHMGDWADGKPLPLGWNLPLLDHVAVRGSGHTPNKKIADYWNGGINWVSLQDTKRLDQVYISETAQTISKQGIANSSAVLHPDGVVVISRDATVGKSAITVGEMAVSQHFIAYRSGPTLDRYYLYYWIQRMKPVFERIAAGSTIKTIGLPFFKSLRIAMPPLEVQREVATTLLDVDLNFIASSKSMQSLGLLKTALTSDLLSGRVRVTTVLPSAPARPAPPAFKRAVFAAEVVSQLHNDSRFGSVKHEKIVHLCELHLGLHADFDRHAYKEAAGPYDPKARRSVERIFQQQKWFEIGKPDGKRVVYIPLEKAGGHTAYFDRYFGNQRPAIQNIIDVLRPLTTEQCEIVATLYAVWNDFLIDRLQPTDDEIVTSVLLWHPKKEEIAIDRWQAALPWMRQKGLVPNGTGEKTRVAQG